MTCKPPNRRGPERFDVWLLVTLLLSMIGWLIFFKGWLTDTQATFVVIFFSIIAYQNSGWIGEWLDELCETLSRG